MSDEITRRALLQAAGGITFLALVPHGADAFALADKTPTAKLLYTALPYIQPGAVSELTPGKESIVVAWQTEARPVAFTVEYGTSKSYGKTATITAAESISYNKAETEGRLNYAALCTDLELNTTYQYRVKQANTTIAEGYFTTRKPRGSKVRFVSFGDNSYGEIGQRGVAYHAYKARPDFIMNTGDNVYEGGLDNEYARYFFPVYNADTADVRIGAPLLRSMPFYTCVANHDVHDKAKDDGRPVADFDSSADSGAYFTLLHLPLNGPSNPPQPFAITGKDAALNRFKKAAGDRFPRMANYSFDYGDAHFLVLDSNVYVNPLDKDWAKYIEMDLFNTNAKWKFVVYHHPAFNAGGDHYTEQHMRVFHPLFEKHRVDFVLNGHEHVYQRTMPFFFAAKDTANAANINTKNRLIPGTFTVDTAFDGKANTKANGVIHITTGAGGKSLYDPGFTDNPSKWLHEEDNNQAYVAKFVSDRHSFTIFDIDGATLTMTQVDQFGTEIDRIKITKA